MTRLIKRAVLIANKPNSHRGRRCDNCGEPYLRRNMYEAWDQQNPGHRDGWHKLVLKICTRCQNASKVQRSLVVVEATITKALPAAHKGA